MEDLRVLEQQQRESQRLLAAIKLTKKHKVDQLAHSEQQLATAKFTNGESRAMLAKYRQILSQKMREYGSLKIRRTNASVDLKRVDEKLRRALITAERLRAYKCKINIAILSLHNSTSMQEKRLRQSEMSLKNSEMKRDDAKHREKILLKSIADFRSKSVNLSAEIVQVRKSIETYEIDLANAKQMEASTKYRVESILAEITTEERRSQDVKSELQSAITSFKTSEVETKSKINECKANIEVIQKNIDEEVEQTKRYQMEACMDPTGKIFDISMLRDRCDAEEQKLAKETITCEELISRNKFIESENGRLEVAITEIKVKSADISSRTEEGRNAEAIRRGDHDKLLSKLEQEEKEVTCVSQIFEFEFVFCTSLIYLSNVQLKRSTEELTLQRMKSRKEDETKLASQKALLKDEHEAVTELRESIITKEKETEQLDARLELTRNDLSSQIEIARKKADDAKIECDAVERQIDMLQKRNALKDAQTAFEDSKCSHLSVMTGIQSKIDGLRSQYPSLANLYLENFDPNLDLKIQVENSLSKIKNDCQIQIANAHVYRKEKLAKEKEALEKERQRTGKERAAGKKKVVESNSQKERDYERKDIENDRQIKSDKSARRRVAYKRKSAREAATVEAALLLDDDCHTIATAASEGFIDSLAASAYDNSGNDDGSCATRMTVASGYVSAMTEESIQTPERPTRKKSVSFSFDENTYYTQLSDGTSIVSKRKQSKRRMFDEDMDGDDVDEDSMENRAMVHLASQKSHSTAKEVFTKSSRNKERTKRREKRIGGKTTNMQSSTAKKLLDDESFTYDSVERTYDSDSVGTTITRTSRRNSDGDCSPSTEKASSRRSMKISSQVDRKVSSSSSSRVKRLSTRRASSDKERNSFKSERSSKDRIRTAIDDVSSTKQKYSDDEGTRKVSRSSSLKRRSRSSSAPRDDIPDDSRKRRKKSSSLPSKTSKEVPEKQTNLDSTTSNTKSNESQSLNRSKDSKKQMAHTSTSRSKEHLASRKSSSSLKPSTPSSRRTDIDLYPDKRTSKRRNKSDAEKKQLKSYNSDRDPVKRRLKESASSSQSRERSVESVRSSKLDGNVAVKKRMKDSASISRTKSRGRSKEYTRTLKSLEDRKISKINGAIMKKKMKESSLSSQMKSLGTTKASTRTSKDNEDGRISKSRGERSRKKSALRKSSKTDYEHMTQSCSGEQKVRPSFNQGERLKSRRKRRPMSQADPSEFDFSFGD